VEKILRGFPWAGRKVAHHGHFLVNSQKVCHTLELWGLGIPDLSRATTSLYEVMEQFGHAILLGRADRVCSIYEDGTLQRNLCDVLFWEDMWLDGKFIFEIAFEIPNREFWRGERFGRLSERSEMVNLGGGGE
jgi:hypothetical protein